MIYDAIKNSLHGPIQFSLQSLKRAIYRKHNLMLLLEILKCVQVFDNSLLFADCNTLCGEDEG